MSSSPNPNQVLTPTPFPHAAAFSIQGKIPPDRSSRDRMATGSFASSSDPCELPIHTPQITWGGKRLQRIGRPRRCANLTPGTRSRKKTKHHLYIVRTSTTSWEHDSFAGARREHGTCSRPFFPIRQHVMRRQLTRSMAVMLSDIHREDGVPGTPKAEGKCIWLCTFLWPIITWKTRQVMYLSTVVIAARLTITSYASRKIKSI